MAEKILKGINFPGLEDTYIIPEVDSTLSKSGQAADAKAVGDAINRMKEDALNNDIAVLAEAQKSVDAIAASLQQLTDTYDSGASHSVSWNYLEDIPDTMEFKSIILESSTENSTKRFKITVDDSGVLTATEVV